MIRNILLSTVFATLTAACGQPSSSDVNSNVNNGVPPMPVNVSLDMPIAGIDYPTDMPLPSHLANAAILVIEDQRIVAPKASTLAKPQSGIDYPTEIPMPLELKGRKILKLAQDGHERRLALVFQGPLDQLKLKLPNGSYLAVDELASIELAIAGIDFPTDTNDAFFVVVTVGGTRIALR